MQKNVIDMFSQLCGYVALMILVSAMLPLAANAGGINVISKSTGGTVTNIFTGNQVSGNAGNGISITNSGTATSAVTLDGNVASGNGGTGISITNNGGPMTLNMTNNTTSNNGVNGVTITNSSTLNSTIGTGIMSNNGSAGLDITNTGSFTGTLSESDISSNATGVNLINTGTSFSMDMGTAANPGNNNFGFDTNTMNGVAVSNNTGTNVSAQGNFWGQSSGPPPIGKGRIVNTGAGSTVDTSNRLLSPRIRR